MKNHQFRKSMLAVIIAALLGGLMFGGLTWSAVADVDSYTDGTYLFGLLADAILDGTKFGDWLYGQHSKTLNYLVVAIVNGLLGAFIFAIATAIWKFIVFAQDSFAASARAKYGNDKPVA